MTFKSLEAYSSWFIAGVFCLSNSSLFLSLLVFYFILLGDKSFKQKDSLLSLSDFLLTEIITW